MPKRLLTALLPIFVALMLPASAGALRDAVPTTGVNLPGVWWDVGLTGNGASIGVLQDQWNRDHQWLRGHTVVTAPDQTSSSTTHGSATVSVIASKDATDKGIAYNIDRLIDADNLGSTCSIGGSGSVKTWAYGINQRCDWGAGQPIPGITNPPDVFTDSSGSVPDAEGIPFDDFLIDTTGIIQTQSAGNDGPDNETVHKQCSTYNNICVGASYDNRSSPRADDTIWSDSSRGPVVDTNRKKPDLVAPGQAVIIACAEYPDPPCVGTPGTPENGTSLSAPMVAGGVALLASVGVSNPKSQKAILINSADGIGAQTTWQADAGWGQLAMDTAYRQRSNSIVNSVGVNGAKFFEANVGNGDKATLVWHRRASYDLVPAPGGTPTNLYDVSDLNLRQYTTGQVERDASTSMEDNVEQVVSPSAETEAAIYKVDANGSIDGANTEEFAIAGTQPLTQRTTPTVDQTATQSNTQVNLTTDVTIQTTVVNGGELTAGNATATINLPEGVTLTGGSQTQAVGGADNDLQPSESDRAAWTVRGSSDGLKQITVDARGESFGEVWRSEKSFSVTVDSTGPSAGFGALAEFSTSPAIGLNWTGSDGTQGTGVSNWQVQVSENGGTYTDVQGSLSASTTFASFTGRESKTYRFRVRGIDQLRNAGAWAYSRTTTVDTVGPSVTVTPGNLTPGGRDVTLLVAISDATSGIAYKAYSVDGGRAIGFGGDTFHLTGLNSGSHSVGVSAVDVAGNLGVGSTSFAVSDLCTPFCGKKKAKITKFKIRRKGRKLRISGAITRGVKGNVRITVKYIGKKPRSKRLRKRVRKARKRFAKIKKRRFRKTVKVPISGRFRVTVKFRGSDEHKPSKRSRRVTVR